VQSNSILQSLAVPEAVPLRNQSFRFGDLLCCCLCEQVTPKFLRPRANVDLVRGHLLQRDKLPADIPQLLAGRHHIRDGVQAHRLGVTSLDARSTLAALQQKTLGCQLPTYPVLLTKLKRTRYQASVVATLSAFARLSHTHQAAFDLVVEVGVRAPCSQRASSQNRGIKYFMGSILRVQIG
jgi:hypothetical protein